MRWKPLLIFLVMSQHSKASDFLDNSTKKLLLHRCQVLDHDLQRFEEKHQELKRKLIALKVARPQVNPLKRPKHSSQIELLESGVKEIEKKIELLNNTYKKSCS